jgi:transposase
MQTVHVIRHKVLVEGLSIRAVARQLGLSRTTVYKYLEVSQPQRVESKPRSQPVLTAAASRLDALLAEWSGRTTPKQRLTAARLHRQLSSEGFSISERSVRRYLRQQKLQSAEVFIPLSYHAGELAEVDFFEVVVEESGTQRKAWKFLMRLMYSGADFVWLYDHCDQLSFLDAHTRAFSYFGGVPQRIAYDNLTPAVRKIIGGERVLTERFAALASHYLFEPCFARPGEGHDKGGVESRGKAIRLQHLTPIPRGETLKQIASSLLADLEGASRKKTNAAGQTVWELLSDEKKCLRELPPAAFEASRVQCLLVSNRALVQIEGAKYSVPSAWAGHNITAHVGVDEIRLSCADQTEVHVKQRRGIKVIKYRHYLPELSRKPQALRQVAPELMPELGEPYARLWDLLEQTHGGREAARVFSRIVAAIVEHGAMEVGAALEQLISSDSAELSRSMSQRSQSRTVPELIPVPELLAGYEVEAGRASDYDFLLTGGMR